MASIGQLFVTLSLKGADFVKGVATAERSIGGFEKSVKGVTSSLFSLKSVAIGALAGWGLSRVVGEFEKLSASQQQAEAGLVAAMTSMGRYTNGFRDKLLDLSGELQNLTTFEDDAILSGAKFLMTYRQISDDVMPRAIRTMTDLAALTGGDMTGAANMLGKAAMGMTGSLRRAGITVEESTFKSKGFLGVLKEIEDQVHGQAAALAATNYGRLLNFGNAVGEAKEKFGDFTIAVKANLVGVLLPELQRMNKALIDLQKSGELDKWALEIAVGVVSSFRVMAESVGYFQEKIIEGRQGFAWLMEQWSIAKGDFAAADTWREVREGFQGDLKNTENRFTALLTSLRNMEAKLAASAGAKVGEHPQGKPGGTPPPIIDDEATKKAKKAAEEQLQALSEYFRVSYEDAQKYADTFADEQWKTANDLSEKIRGLALSDTDIKMQQLELELENLREYAEGDAQIQDQIAAYRLMKNAEIQFQNDEMLSTMASTWGLTWEEIRTGHVNVMSDIASATAQVTTQFASDLVDMAMGMKSIEAVAKGLFNMILKSALQTLIQIGMQKLILAAVEKSIMVGMTAAQVASLTAITAAAAPAAILTALATGGASAVSGASAYTGSLAGMAASTLAMKSATMGALMATPSFDEGGISTRPQMYYAGVPEAHIPLKNGSVPVEIIGAGGRGTGITVAVNVSNSVFRTAEDEERMIQEIAAAVASEVGPYETAKQIMRREGPMAYALGLS